MKAKLSFSALPAFVGLVITIVLVACGGDSPSGNKPPDGGTSSPITLSSNSSVPGKIDIRSFDLDHSEFTRVDIIGQVVATEADPITKLELKTNNNSWILYKGAPVSGVIQIDPPSSGFWLNAWIDLTNETIPCGVDINVQVTAWTKANLVAIAGSGKSFRKDEFLCAKSSSGGAELSSSSVGGWKFGEPTRGEVSNKAEVQIGSGSFQPMCRADDPDCDNSWVGNLDLKINNGKIRFAAPCGGAGPEGNIVPGNPYSSEGRCLGSEPAKDILLSQVDGEDSIIQNGEYYLIYLNDGNKYLLIFTDIKKWPIKYIYWLATESPQ